LDDLGVGGHLTGRQAEVLRLAVRGLVAKEIARSLGISARTVEGHLGAMRRLAGAKNMAELAAWGITAGVARRPQLADDASSREVTPAGNGLQELEGVTG